MFNSIWKIWHWWWQRQLLLLTAAMILASAATTYDGFDGQFTFLWEVVALLAVVMAVMTPFVDFTKSFCCGSSFVWLIHQEVMAVVAALFVGFAKGCCYGSGFIWHIGQRLWFRLLASPKIANALAALFDSLIRGCGGSCGFDEGWRCVSGIIWLIHQRLWLCSLASSKVANALSAVFDSFVGGCGASYFSSSILTLFSLFLLAMLPSKPSIINEPYPMAL